MINVDYQRLIQELCNEAGIDDWGQVAESRHVDVEGVTTGLLCDETDSPNTLAIYFDFGVTHDVEVLRRLLEYNAAFGPEVEGNGYFALLPEEGKVTYRVNMPWTDATNGGQLLTDLGEFLKVAKQGYESCVSPY